MSLFKVSEIVDMGIEKEKKRRDFYAEIAAAFKAGEVYELFAKLRDWEEEHVAKFEAIRAKLSETETTGSYPAELADYMDSLIGSKLYRAITPEQISEAVKTPVMALEYGIGFEKDAVLFFMELLPLVPEDSQPVIRELIEEEKQHIVYLYELGKKMLEK